MANSLTLNKKTFFLISGASQGIGQQIAIECSRNLAPGSIVVLLARNLAGLNATSAKISSINTHITVTVMPIDLSRPTPNEISSIFDNALLNRNPTEFELAYIVHNVGTIGDITKMAHQLDDTAVWQQYYDINVFSVATLNARFMQVFANNQKLCVNVTSKCSSVPYPSFALYCSSRAAREMYFKVLVAENHDLKTGGTLLVLNYSPGVCDTQMTVDVQNHSADAELRTNFEKMRTEASMITPQQTALKLIKILLAGVYHSGDYADYYNN